MVIILGESGSGKSTVAKSLETLGYHNVVTYTTREPRDGEIDEIDYHFLTDDKFNELQDTGFFGEVGEYRGWKYGSAINTYNDDSVLVLTPTGMRQIKSKNLEGINMHSFYIYVPRRDRLIKILQRGDNIEECYRRSLSDIGMFDDISKEVDFVIENGDYNKTPLELASMISILDKRYK